MKLTAAGEKKTFTFYAKLFLREDPKNAKRHLQLYCLYALLGSARVKSYA